MMAFETPDLLYHTTLTVIDYQADTSGSIQAIYVLGTHGTLEAAKKFASTALQELNYAPDDFAKYETRSTVSEWRYGDGVLVVATAPNGQMLRVGLDTKPNDAGLLLNSDDGTIVLPKDVPHLHYVLQTTVNYNQDRSGAAQSSEIEGCYVRRDEAVEAAKKCLSGEQDEYSQYDERSNLGEDEEWPFGEDVLVHAVAQTGENYSVAVRTVPGAHKKHAKKPHHGKHEAK